MKNYQFEFYNWEKNNPNKPFLKQPFGDRWETWTWGEVGQKARKLATGLQSLGLPPKSHIGLVSKNCREWIVADIAIMMAGYVSVPFFATLTGKQIETVLRLGDVKALFVGKMEVWEDMKTGVAADMPVIKFPHYEGNSKIDRGHDWDEFINKFELLQGERVFPLEDIWTIIFTSGTTGTPKGVMLDYQVLENSKIPTNTTNPLKVDMSGDNHFFSYLPLNHIAERIIVESGVIHFGGTISFSESLARFAQNLADAKPTVFFGVPRIYTKFQQGILSKMPEKKLNMLLKIPILSGLIKKKIRNGLGWERTKMWVSGAAPLAEATKSWYNKIGVGISNGYAMTENCAICTMLDGAVSKPGSVGGTQSGVKIKIDEETGEILNRSPYVMRGYYKEPEKTAEVLKDGWLHTGDQGYIDDDGDLHITGRVKDTFKTAKGKYIVPGPLEWGFGANNDIEQICLVGLGCPQPLALVNLSAIGAKKSKAEIMASLEASRKSVNKDVPNYQKIDKIIVVKDAWAVENGILTPTLKVKRNVVNKHYEAAISKWVEAVDTVLFE